MSEYNEPWKVEEGRGWFLSDANGDVMGQDLPSVTRIARCVNACSGIPTADLVSGKARVVQMPMEWYLMLRRDKPLVYDELPASIKAQIDEQIATLNLPT